jgi:tRNA-5-methyluridine54 2-sulfurtransferase
VCEKCGKTSVSMSPNYCKEHFISYFEEKVRMTIKKFNLIGKKEAVAVAVSGGKDSMSLLYLLNKLGYKVTALAIDEGISGYRDKTLNHMKRFCHKNKIPYKIVSFEQRFGLPLDKIVKRKNVLPCSVCGVFRRCLINLYSKKFDVLATGHNMDDEGQAIIMNLLKTNISLLARLGPVSGHKKRKEFTKRVKPFYLCTEKEIMTYSFLNRLNTEFKECPYVKLSFRLKIRDLLNELEYKKPGTKRKIVDFFLNLNLKDREDINFQRHCILCGEPSSNEICGSCAFLNTLKSTTI